LVLEIEVLSEKEKAASGEAALIFFGGWPVRYRERFCTGLLFG
jgi:hypothetical protein